MTQVSLALSFHGLGDAARSTGIVPGGCSKTRRPEAVCDLGAARRRGSGKPQFLCKAHTKYAGAQSAAHTHTMFFWLGFWFWLGHLGAALGHFFATLAVVGAWRAGSRGLKKKKDQQNNPKKQPTDFPFFLVFLVPLASTVDMPPHVVGTRSSMWGLPLRASSL
jgi:hypothetical protein